MKFLHAADIHLDSPLEGLERYEGAPVELIRGATRRALERLIDLAIREQVDFVVVAGDLYDGDWRDFNTGLFFLRQIDKLLASGIRLYLIAGNHDAANLMTRKLRLPSNPEGDSVMLSHITPETRRIDDLGVAIHGRSFANQAEKQNMVPQYPAPIAHWFNIGLLHTSLNGSEDHDTYAPCTPADLRSKGYDYWALGHIHKRSSATAESTLDPAAGLFSGNIQGRHIRETGPRGCFLVTVDEQQRPTVEFRPLDVFRWEVCTVDCGSCATSEDALDQVGTALRSLIACHPGCPLGVRIRLEGATTAHRELLSHRAAITAEIRNLAASFSHEQVWVEQVKLVTSDLHVRPASSAAAGPLEELDRYLQDLQSNPAALTALIDELKDLTRKLPPELLQPPDGLLLDSPDWIRGLLREVEPMLMDRLNNP